jgi:hypothetical protein
MFIAELVVQVCEPIEHPIADNIGQLFIKLIIFLIFKNFIIIPEQKL